jgi:hypothetical protein
LDGKGTKALKRGQKFPILIAKRFEAKQERKAGTAGKIINGTQINADENR